ncbi:hypothetical protein HSB1_45310 [Halogranum salarium B-1]|uniref:Uncharacterized protein n=1 Tax=Halogranum salarium B-1 TaxID=1210908 RepID=J2Z937_9EURY|nr:hypothetical protein HSB1_45310 [Halogranum salarium B-1]
MLYVRTPYSELQFRTCRTGVVRPNRVDRNDTIQSDTATT